MFVRYITCSDPRDHNSFRELHSLWFLDDRVEIAVQMHPGKVSKGTQRYEWISDVVHSLEHDCCNDYNLAIHVNSGWCGEICNGKIPEDLLPLFKASHRMLYESVPIVKRIQLNMPKGVAESFNPQKLKTVIDAFPRQEFILQYNNVTKQAVDALYKTGASFTLLYDSSGGRGISPNAWSKPVYNGRMMGYSGGLSPENIADNLSKISQVTSADDMIWIDAEGKLKTNDLFDVARARDYIKNVKNWEYLQSRIR
ncbi:MAG: hypothetical protein J6Y49_00805 [Alphaproteobacteria bacterium]|nr:hypothetical protein [Alphaproteobacteria bacterium]